MLDVAFVVGDIEVKLRMRVGQCELHHDALHRHKFREIVRNAGSMMRKCRSRTRQKPDGHEQNDDQISFHSGFSQAREYLRRSPDCQDRLGTTNGVLPRASKPVIARYMLLEKMCHGAPPICDELDPQPMKAGEIGFRLRHKPVLLPSFEFGE